MHRLVVKYPEAFSLKPPYYLTIKWPGEEEETYSYMNLGEAKDAKQAALSLGSFDNKPVVFLEDDNGVRL